MNDNWQKDLKDHAGDFRRKAPEGLLDDIKKEMSRRGLAVQPQQKKARVVLMPLRRRLAAAAAVAVLLGIGCLYFTSAPDYSAQLAKEQGNTSKANAHDRGQKIDSPVSDDVLNEQDGEHTPSFLLASSPIGKAIKAVRSEFVDKKEDSTNMAQIPVQQQEEAHTSNQYIKDEPHPTVDNKKSIYPVSKPHKLVAQASPRNHSVTLGAYCGGMGSNTSSSDGMMLRDAAPYGMYGDDMDIVDALFVQSVPQLEKKAHHDLPVKGGISIRYDLTDRWSLVSGITYSFLHSEFTEDKGMSTEKTNQKLHYVGIPVGVNYRVWKNKHVNLYLAAGGEAEKLVKGSATTTTDIHGIPTKDRTAKISENQLVLSANAAAGIEYQATKRLGLYVEPGVSYYFNNGSDVKSAYTDKPLNFSLNLGLRFNINK